MKLVIREVKSLKGNIYGEYCVDTNVIRISRKRCKMPKDYFLTLLHEVGHFGFDRLRARYRLELSDEEEHALIEKAENVFTAMFLDQMLKARKKK